MHIQLMEDFWFGEEQLREGTKYFVEERWAMYNKPAYVIKRGKYEGIYMPKDICKEIKWDDYSKEEKQAELQKRMDEQFEKITFHLKKEAYYRAEVTTILQELEELNS